MKLPAAGMPDDFVNDQTQGESNMNNNFPTSQVTEVEGTSEETSEEQRGDTVDRPDLDTSSADIAEAGPSGSAGDSRRRPPILDTSILPSDPRYNKYKDLKRKGLLTVWTKTDDGARLRANTPRDRQYVPGAFEYVQSGMSQVKHVNDPPEEKKVQQGPQTSGPGSSGIVSPVSSSSHDQSTLFPVSPLKATSTIDWNEVYEEHEEQLQSQSPRSGTTFDSSFDRIAADSRADEHMEQNQAKNETEEHAVQNTGGVDVVAGFTKTGSFEEYAAALSSEFASNDMVSRSMHVDIPSIYIASDTKSMYAAPIVPSCPSAEDASEYLDTEEGWEDVYRDESEQGNSKPHNPYGRPSTHPASAIEYNPFADDPLEETPDIDVTAGTPEEPSLTAQQLEQDSELLIETTRSQCPSFSPGEETPDSNDSRLFLLADTTAESAQPEESSMAPPEIRQDEMIVTELIDSEYPPFSLGEAEFESDNERALPSSSSPFDVYKDSSADDSSDNEESDDNNAADNADNVDDDDSHDKSDEENDGGTVEDEDKHFDITGGFDVNDTTIGDSNETNNDNDDDGNDKDNGQHEDKGEHKDNGACEDNGEDHRDNGYGNNINNDNEEEQLQNPAMNFPFSITADQIDKLNRDPDSSALEKFLADFNHNIITRFWDLEFLVRRLQPPRFPGLSSDSFDKWRKRVFVSLQNDRWKQVRANQHLQDECEIRRERSRQLREEMSFQRMLLVNQREKTEACLAEKDAAIQAVEVVGVENRELRARLTAYRARVISESSASYFPSSATTKETSTTPTLPSRPQSQTQPDDLDVELDRDFAARANRMLASIERIRKLVVPMQLERNGEVGVGDLIEM